MHIIPSLIPEAVLGTKEPSEKARSAAFDLIVAMGNRMKEGGVVKMDMIDGMEENDDPPKEGMLSLLHLHLTFVDYDIATASVEEYMTMVAGGLAGASPHMISASITAISRLVFEFKSEMLSDTLLIHA